MKFRCERDTLVDSLSTTGRAVTNRAGPAGLNGICLEVVGDRLRLVGSDRDLTIRADVVVAGLSDGTCVLPARLTTDIVRSLEPGAVTLEAAGEEVRISSGRSQFSVRMLVDELPLLPASGTEERPAATLDAALLAEALRQVVRAASSDDTMPVISGVLLAPHDGGLRLVATDRYRLAVRDLPGVDMLAGKRQVLVPGRALAEVQRLLAGTKQVSVELGERDASFTAGPVRLSTRLIEGDFPPYQVLIPSNYPNRLVVGREALLDALRRVKLLARDAITPVRVSLRAGTVECTVVTQEVGQASEDLDAKYEGAELLIGFNPAYLIDGLEAVVGDEVLFETLDAGKPATLRAVEGQEFLYLLMPIKL
ncbi:MAG: DNA polymerase III subunit beta [Gemmatimonadales bacterium]